MSNRRFEMYQYRHIVYRIRSGETDRAIAKAGLMGRRKTAVLRRVSQSEGWLNPGPLPGDAEIAAALKHKKSVPLQGQSLVLPYADEVRTWLKQGINGTTIYQALVRKYHSSAFTEENGLPVICAAQGGDNTPPKRRICRNPTGGIFNGHPFG